MIDIKPSTFLMIEVGFCSDAINGQAVTLGSRGLILERIHNALNSLPSLRFIICLSTLFHGYDFISFVCCLPVVRSSQNRKSASCGRLATQTSIY